MMHADSKLACCLGVLLLLSLARAAVERPSFNAAESDLPIAWFWGDVAGESFLTRVQNERAPKYGHHGHYGHEGCHLACSYCRASWALSTVVALSDRLKISNPGSHPDRSLSPQVLLNCVSTSDCSVRGI